MDPILSYLKKERNCMLEMLQLFVENESPSIDKRAVDHFGSNVKNAALGFNGRVRSYPSQSTGNHLRAEFDLSPGQTKGQVLLLGHLDTVWGLETIQRMPFRLKQGKAFGPGVFDMKSGIVCGLFALKALQNLKVSVHRKVVLLLTGDEEIGSVSSRRIIEKEATRSEFVLVLEPAYGPRGALKTARKGVGKFQVRVCGRSAHAGLEPEKGASAISELCRQVIRIERFSNLHRGITINTGVIMGGSVTNVVAPEARAQFDVRVWKMQDMKEIEQKFRLLEPCDYRTRLEVTGGFNRPPMERTKGVAQLFEEARRTARILGISLTESRVGGASDGNFTAALGIPTLDGLGGVGEGAHAEHESIIVAELPLRAALIAHLIASAKVS